MLFLCQSLLFLYSLQSGLSTKSWTAREMVPVGCKAGTSPAVPQKAGEQLSSVHPALLHAQ